MCSKSHGRMSRLGLLIGIFALTILIIAFVSSSWLYTREPIQLPNSRYKTSITFRIGLWRLCPHVNRINSSIHVPSPSCSLVKYSVWGDVGDLGVWSPLDFTPVFVSRMRCCTLLCGIAVTLLVFAILFGLTGYCNGDNKSVIACGLFISGGLSLGAGLVIFISSLSDTLMEILQYRKDPPGGEGPLYDYRYGWCFFAAGLAFVMTNIAALFSISGYLNRFSSVDEMVRLMVPGAERKLQECQYFSTHYLVRVSGHSTQYDILTTDGRQYEEESGPLLNKTPPDVCTTNICPNVNVDEKDQSSMLSNLLEPSYGVTHTFAGQTIPITIKNNNSTAPLSFSNVPIKYGTIRHTGTLCMDNSGTILHQGFLGVSDLASSSSTSSRGYYDKSTTNELPRNS